MDTDAALRKADAKAGNTGKDAKDSAKKKLGLNEEQFNNVVKIAGGVAAFVALVAAGYKWGGWGKDKADDYWEDAEDVGKHAKRKASKAVRDAKSKAADADEDVRHGINKVTGFFKKKSSDVADSVDQAASETVDRASKGREGIRGAVADARDKAGHVIHDAQHTVAGGAHAVVDKGKDVKHGVQEGVHRAIHVGQEQVHHGQHAAEEAYGEAKHAVGKGVNKVKSGGRRVAKEGEKLKHGALDKGEEWGDELDERREKLAHGADKFRDGTFAEGKKGGCSIM